MSSMVSSTLRGSSGAALRLACGLAVLFVWPQRSASAQERLWPTQNPLAGSEVFEAKGCGKCHAVEGLGGSVGPDLADIPQRRSFHELAAGLWNHLPLMGEGMRQYEIEQPQMNGREAADLIAFLFTLDYFDAPGDVEIGKRLFREKRCFVCHRVGNFGGEIGPSLNFLGQYGSPILVAAAMWNHGPAMADTMDAHGVRRPTFEGSQLSDLIAYMQSVSPEPLEGSLYVLPGRAETGRVIFVEKRCNQCHSVLDVGGKVGPDLAARGRKWGLIEFAAAMWNKAPAMLEAMKQRGIWVPRLGATEMADLVAYLYSVEYFADAGDAEMGRQRLSDQRCLSCHSVEGSGGKTASDLSRVTGLESPATVIASLWNHSLLATTDREGEEIRWPKLSTAEMADLMAYLQGIASLR
ncbi:MAG: c-type cytochrome [Gemmatimonadales bacterium]|nr:c-type cytochrome [Gemmatimonadales bacterium]